MLNPDKLKSKDDSSTFAIVSRRCRLGRPYCCSDGIVSLQLRPIKGSALEAGCPRTQLGSAHALRHQLSAIAPSAARSGLAFIVAHFAPCLHRTSSLAY